MTKLALISSIALFGALGALARVFLGTWVQGLFSAGADIRFPLGTLVVNVLGCFVFGLLGSLGHQTETLPPFWRTVLLSGFLGSFTTFSAFSYETVLLFESAPHGKLLWAGANILLNVLLGVTALLGGLYLGKLATGS